MGNFFDPRLGEVFEEHEFYETNPAVRWVNLWIGILNLCLGCVISAKRTRR